MIRVKKIALMFVLLLLTMPVLSSCSQGAPASCREILGEIIYGEIGLPAGKIYDVKAPEGKNEYLNERLISTLFGGGSPPPMRDGWLDVALFLPATAHPCEFAVILCDSADTATDTARLLCRRLDSIRSTKGGGDYSALLESATVTVIGNYALLIVSSDTQNSIKVASKVIRHR
jgi:hypothetical protein